MDGGGLVCVMEKTLRKRLLPERSTREEVPTTGELLSVLAQVADWKKGSILSR